MGYLICLPLLFFCAIHACLQWQRRRLLTLRLRTLGVGEKQAQHQRRIALLVKPLAGTAERGRLSLRLINAGWRNPAAVDVFLLSKLALFLLALAVGFFLTSIDLQAPLARPLALGKLLVLLYVVARLPDWWLSERIRARQQRIRNSVPQMIDLLTVCADAGLSLEDGLTRVAAEILPYAPEIAVELRQTASELMIMPDRSEALERLGSRSNVDELVHLSKVLIQSLQFGTPLAQAMHCITADCRAREIAALEEKAGKLAASIGIPLIVLVLFPLVALMTAPAVINLLRTLDKVGK